MDSDIYSSENLEHFGIRGMRWGVVKKEDSSSTPNVKPDQATQDKRNKRAEKYVVKAAAAKKEISRLDATKPRTKYEASVNQLKKEDLQRQQKEALSAAKAKKQGYLTDREKTLVKGAAIAGAVLVAYGTYNALQSGRGHSLSLRGKAMLSSKGVVSWKKNLELADKTLSADEISQKVVKGINPRFGKWGTKMNCRRCTFAYEMRRRGNEVAATATSNARGQTIGGLYNATTDTTDFVGGKTSGIGYHMLKEKVQSKLGKGNSPFTQMIKASQLGEETVQEWDGGSYHSSIFKAIGRHPNGARGELTVAWTGGGAHSMAWEVVHGKPVIFDTQSGKVFKTAKQLDDVVQGRIGEAALTRLDNKSLNPLFIQRWLQNG